MCSTQIQSGWRPLFSALETVHSSSKSEVKEYLVGEYSMGKDFLHCFMHAFNSLGGTVTTTIYLNTQTEQWHYNTTELYQSIWLISWGRKESRHTVLTFCHLHFNKLLEWEEKLQTYLNNSEQDSSARVLSLAEHLTLSHWRMSKRHFSYGLVFPIVWNLLLL